MAYSEIRPEASSGQRNHFMPLFVWAGVVGPVLFVLLFTVAGFLYPGYSPVRQAISTLGASGPYPWIQVSNFLVSGFLLLLFAFGFCQEMRLLMHKGALFASTILLALAGAGLVDAGIFAESIPGDPRTMLRGALHTAGFLVIIFSLVSAFLLTGWSLRKVPDWRWYGLYSMIAGIVTFGLFIVFAAVGARAPQFFGLWNRILIIEAFAWYVVMGWRFLTRNSKTAA